MSQTNTQQYQRNKVSTNPFGKPPRPHTSQTAGRGVPGSEWKLPQIEWLGIKKQWGCDISQMLSSESEFKPNSQLQSWIVDALSMPWEDITSKDLSGQFLYSNLAQLARIPSPLDEYDKSSTIQGLSSPPASKGQDPIRFFSSPEQRHKPSTPTQQIPSSPPRMPASVTPRSKRQSQFPSQSHNAESPFSSPLSSPPVKLNLRTSASQRQSLPSTSASGPSSDDQDRSKVEKFVEDHDDGSQGSGSADDGTEKDGGGEVGSGDDGVKGRPNPTVPRLPPWHDSKVVLNEDSQAKRQKISYSLSRSSSHTDRWSNLRRTKDPVSYATQNHSSDVGQDLKSHSPSEDLDYHPSSFPGPLDELEKVNKVQRDAEHKSEEDVKHTARLFLQELVHWLEIRCKDSHIESQGHWELLLAVGPGKNTKSFMIDANSLVSNGDVTLTVTAIDKSSESPKNREVRLLLECKPVRHNLKPDAIFGQELAEMLAEVQRLREYHRLNRYMVFLMSWHHLECYFSRMDVGEAYMAQLHDTSNLLSHDPPLVRQSRMFTFRDDSDRLEIGQICVRIVIEMLAKYKQPKKLGIIRHLRS